MKLFTMEGHVVQINPETRLVPEFRRIVERDKDRTKKLALAELAFIYHTTDNRSVYADLGEKEQLAKVTRDLKLTDWKPDDELRAAIAKYKLLQLTPATRTLVSIKEGLNVSTKAINALTTRISEQLDTIDTLSDDDGEPLSIDAIMKNVDQLMKLSEKLPGLITTIDKLEEQVNKEQSGDTKLRGGGAKGMFED